MVSHIRIQIGCGPCPSSVQLSFRSPPQKQWTWQSHLIFDCFTELFMHFMSLSPVKYVVGPDDYWFVHHWQNRKVAWWYTSATEASSIFECMELALTQLIKPLQRRSPVHQQFKSSHKIEGELISMYWRGVFPIRIIYFAGPLSWNCQFVCQDPDNWPVV